LPQPTVLYTDTEENTKNPKYKPPMVVTINFTFVNDNAVEEGSSIRTLAKGEWIPDPSDEIKIDKVYSPVLHSTPKKSVILDHCDGTPTTTPTMVTPTKIQLDNMGKPEMIEYIESDDYSISTISTMGDSVYDDAKPSGRRARKTRHANMMFGSF
jgi:hypothetical protein